MDAPVHCHTKRLAMRGALSLFVAAVSLSLLVLHATESSAQPQVGRDYRIAMVSTASEDERSKILREALVATLGDLGYAEGTNLTYIRRFADGDRNRLAVLVDEVVALKPDLLLGAEDAALVMHARTKSIPIVLVGGIDPVSAGLVRSLARPGTNVTGVALLNYQLPEKHISLMRDINPRLARVAMLVDRDAPTCRLSEDNAREAAQRIGAAFVPHYVRSRETIEQAFMRMKEAPPDLLLPCPTPLMLYFRELMIDSVLSLHIPFTSFVVTTARKGVLFSYAESDVERTRKIASYVDKLLEGASPADLPIEQPTKLDLVINLRTAQPLGLTIPLIVLLRADYVIE